MYWGKFGKFIDAIKDEKRIVSNDRIAESIIVSGKFYFPLECRIINEDNFDIINTAKELPFENTTILTPIKFDNGDIIYTCILLQKTEANGWLFIVPSWSEKNEVIVSNFGIMINTNNHLSLENLLENVRYFSLIKGYSPKDDDEVNKDFLMKFVALAFDFLQILKLLNTKIINNPVPIALSKKKNRHKKPLYSYNVLEVNGERWDSSHIHSGDGVGKRSHMRRGHIRNIGDDRYTWVRACFVRGSVPGFVDKEYHVKVAT